MAIAPLNKTAEKFSYLLFSFNAISSSAVPRKYTAIIQILGLIRLFSIAYFAPYPTPSIISNIPTMLITLVPIKLSTSSTSISLGTSFF